MRDATMIVEERRPMDQQLLPWTPGLLALIGAVSVHEDLSTRELVFKLRKPVADVFRRTRKDHPNVG